MEKSIGALWKKQGNKGEYMTGNIEIDGGEFKIVVFANGFKDKETQPDYRIYKSQPKQQEANIEPDSDLPF